MDDEKIQNAFKTMDDLSATVEEKLAAEAYLKPIIDEAAAKREAELRIEEARRTGIRTTIETVARRLLAKEMDINFIAEVTGLEKERIVELRE